MSRASHTCSTGGEPQGSIQLAILPSFLSEGDWVGEDSLDNLVLFLLEVSSQELLKVFETFLVNGGNRCLVLFDLVFKLFFLRLHGVSILGCTLGGHETGTVCNVILELEILDEHLVGTVTQITTSVLPSPDS